MTFLVLIPTVLALLSRNHWIQRTTSVLSSDADWIHDHVQQQARLTPTSRSKEMLVQRQVPQAEPVGYVERFLKINVA